MRGAARQTGSELVDLDAAATGTTSAPTTRGSTGADRAGTALADHPLAVEQQAVTDLVRPSSADSSGRRAGRSRCRCRYRCRSVPRDPGGCRSEPARDPASRVLGGRYRSRLVERRASAGDWRSGSAPASGRRSPRGAATAARRLRVRSSSIATSPTGSVVLSEADTSSRVVGRHGRHEEHPGRDDGESTSLHRSPRRRSLQGGQGGQTALDMTNHYT